MNIKRLIIPLILSCLLVFSYLSASDYGTTGKIAGKVTDKETGQLLMGVNIVVRNTTHGAATDDNGLYTIIQVPPGTYELECSYMGYRKTIVENVQVQVDLTTRVDIELEQTTLELDEVITVVAERPLIQRDVTSTSHKTSGEEIVDMPSVTDAQDVVATMAGVVGDGETISVRGGRSGEVVYMIDGMPVNDPLYNEQTLSVNKYAIQEIELQTGGFNAEYGNVQSGVVNIVTRSGGRRLSGRVAFFTDDFGSGKFISEQDPFDLDHSKWFKPIGTGLNTYSQNTDRLEFNLGGPELIANNILPALGINFLRGKADFFLSGTVETSDGYIPNGDQKKVKRYKATYDFDEYGNAVNYEFLRNANGDPIPEVVDHPFYLPVFPGIFGEGGLFKWGGRDDNRFNFNMSGNIRISDNKRISISYLNAQSWRAGYRHYMKFVPTKNDLRFSNGNTVTIGWNHTLSSNSFYQVRFQRFANRREIVPGLYNGELHLPYLMNQEIGKGLWDSYSTGEGGPPDYIGQTEYGVTADGTIMDESFFGGFVKFHNPPPAIDGGGGWWGARNWQVNDTKTYMLKADYLNQVTPNHELKTGIELKYMDLNHQRISNGGSIIPTRNYENTNGKWPQHGSLRDFYRRYPNQGAYYVQDKIEYETLIVNLGLRFDWYDVGDQVEMPDGSGRKVPIKKYFSPRLGVSHPITERAVLYFFYGKFLQFPDYNNMYRQQNRYRVFQNQLNLFGNPDLEAEETTSYEVGLDYQLFEDVKIGLTGFMKDNKNLIDSEVRGTTADNWSILVNRDYGTDRGFEFDITKRYSNYLSGRFNYTLGWATGKSSTFTQGFDSGLGGLVPLKETYLNWDQRHTINADIRFEAPRGTGPSLFGRKIDRWGIAFLIRYGSGRPYTPDIGAGAGFVEENSARRPYTLTVDVRFRKDFNLYRNLIGSFYFDVFNIFNKRNVYSVYADTGTPEGNNSPYEANPSYLGPPRNILIGFGFRF